MKKKLINFDLNKTTIARLNKSESNQIVGGGQTDLSICQTANCTTFGCGPGGGGNPTTTQLGATCDLEEVAETVFVPCDRES